LATFLENVGEYYQSLMAIDEGIVDTRAAASASLEILEAVPVV